MIPRLSGHFRQGAGAPDQMSAPKRHLETSTTSHNPKTLKSTFNPTWEAFNVHGLSETVVKSWHSSLAALDRANENTTDRAWKLEFRDGNPHIVRQLPLAGFLRPAAPQAPPAAPVAVVGAGLPAWRGPGEQNAVEGEPIFERHVIPNVVELQRMRVPLWQAVRLLEDPMDVDVEPEPQVVRPRVRPAIVSRAASGGEHLAIAPLAPSPSPSDEVVSQNAGAEGHDDTAQKVPRFTPVAKEGTQVVATALDIRSVGLLERSWLVSRKKNQSVGDIVNAWKKEIIQTALHNDNVPMHVDEWQ